MNQQIRQLALQAGYRPLPGFEFANSLEEVFIEKFAELIVRECTGLLFDESERLYGYSTECDNMRESEEAELVSEKCVDLITMIEEHFGV